MNLILLTMQLIGKYWQLYLLKTENKWMMRRIEQLALELTK